jgi:hypothetical protein
VDEDWLRRLNRRLVELLRDVIGSRSGTCTSDGSYR